MTVQAKNADEQLVLDFLEVLSSGDLEKLRGFYRDLENEHHSTYTTDGGMLLNGDQA